jgi:hypothetical protein
VAARIYIVGGPGSVKQKGMRSSIPGDIHEPTKTTLVVACSDPTEAVRCEPSRHVGLGSRFAPRIVEERVQLVALDLAAPCEFHMRIVAGIPHPHATRQHFTDTRLTRRKICAP